MSDFLPDGYVVEDAGSNYLKFSKGETRFRFISSPILGKVWFTEDLDGKKSVHRVKQGEGTPPGMQIKSFWAAIVYDYGSNKLKILEITQKTIQAAVLGLNQNPKWGSPKDYDICVVREGDGLETSYNVIPEPKTPVPEGAIEGSKKINLEALFSGDDPFQDV